jgi:hypothetical protein
LIPALQDLVAPETAGDPMNEQKWVRSSLRTLSARLRERGHAVSPPTVGRLLRGLGYARHVNAKQVEARSPHPDRQTQFAYLAQQREAFMAAGLPVISVDTKKKELIGNFKNAGQVWSLEPTPVNVHDFPSDATGRAVPYGIYDLAHNRGMVYVGTSGDTAQFAVDAIAQWWQTEGQAAFAPADQLLILADGGGSNGYRARLWKEQIQTHLCDDLGLTVTVSHYPTGCSKWNPIEHRLFGPISVNWAGTPLRTLDTLLAYIRGTRTTTGLAVHAEPLDGDYPTGQRISDAAMQALQVTAHPVCPAWNYTFTPRSRNAADPALLLPNQEVIV